MTTTPKQWGLTPEERRRATNIVNRGLTGQSWARAALRLDTTLREILEGDGEGLTPEKRRLIALWGVDDPEKLIFDLDDAIRTLRAQLAKKDKENERLRKRLREMSKEAGYVSKY